MERDEINLQLIRQEEEFKKREKEKITRMTMQLGLQIEKQRRAA